VDPLGSRLLHDVNRSAANYRAAACASAEFRQGHPNRHRKALFLLFCGGESLPARLEKSAPRSLKGVNAEYYDGDKIINQTIEGKDN
jgi:hypothetical protein